MGELLPKQRAEASRKGWMAVAGWVVTGLITWRIGLLVGVLGAVAAAWLTGQWFAYRAKWGLRF